MKPTPFLVCAALFVAAAQSSHALPPLVAIESDSEYRTLSWMDNYYAQPQPELLVKRVYVLSRMGFFEQEGQPAQSIGFFAAVFARNPDKLDAWFSDFRGLPSAHRRLLAAAAWVAGSPRAEAYLRQAPGIDAKRLEEVVSANRTLLADSPVLSPASMNLHWGAFLATGDARHIQQILTAVGSKTPGIAESARVSLALNASQHPRVLEICRAELERQPNAVRELLRAALDEAALANKQPTS
ncbi:hypothetical protein DB347_06465 [Opitutaceae bacterium EW11]|nr:hypothetical protein DB347_06465 [Opitutaceae bacterium EW11]